MPFGLVNAPAVFQHAMNKMQKMLPAGEMIPYLDDIVIPSSTVEEGLERLRKFLVVLESLDLKLRALI